MEHTYEIDERMISGPVLEEFQNKYNRTLRSIPQVVINEELIGGFAETEDLLKGPLSINKV